MKKWWVYFEFARSMGFKYSFFRIWYGLFRNFNQAYNFSSFDKRHSVPFSEGFYEPNRVQFFFSSKKQLATRTYGLAAPLVKSPSIPLGDQWHTHPTSGYIYPKVHRTKIKDFAKDAGDIKEVWNRSRFSFLYDLVRVDFHHHRDTADIALQAIEDWINNNPYPLGPNWKCGQEIAIRVLNWTFALFYFKDAPALSEGRVNRILFSIYRQTRHVAAHIHYTRRIIRNNHALSETLLLYLIGTLFPYFPEAARWKSSGKKWFEQEIEFQVNHEGAFLQHSMNYHRVVVQLLTWGIRLGQLNGDRWSPLVYLRAKACIDFLTSFQDPSTGWLPNYGANDGALFFPMSSAAIRDFRPQLGALAQVIGEPLAYPAGAWQEEAFWITGSPAVSKDTSHPLPYSRSFPKSGYFIFRNDDKLMMIRCANYEHRPSQSDNLHLDLWVNGENQLIDAGTFSYHTEEKYRAYYSGTEGHNTAMIENFDQMYRGPRFIWTHWIKESDAVCGFDGEHFNFEGYFTGYTHLSAKGVTHHRTVNADKDLSEIVIIDRFFRKPPTMKLRQLWHPGKNFSSHYHFFAEDENERTIAPFKLNGWYSETYGTKEETSYIEFATYGNSIHTRIISKRKK